MRLRTVDWRTAMNIFDFQFMLEALPKILSSLPISLMITFCAVSSGYLIGLGLTFLKLSRFRLVRTIVSTITTIIRGIPIIVILFLVFFGLPELMALFGINIKGWPSIVFAIIAIMIDVAALSSEMFRCAYLSLDKGQIDAASSIGMGKLMVFFRVILPQGLFVVLPNICNNLILQFQNTSLVYTIGIMDIMGKARLVDGNAFQAKSFEVYVGASIIYFVSCVLIERVFKFLERHFGKGFKVIGQTTPKKVRG